MAEYIAREALMRNLKKFAPEQLTPLIESLIQKQPAADVVEVRHGMTTCKDCNFRKFVAKTFDVHIDWRDCWIQDCKLTREEAEKALNERE